MKKILAAVVVGLVALSLFGLPRPVGAVIKVGDKPNLSFKTTDNVAVTSAGLRGHMVLLDFWATWCGPCMASVPHMKEINEKYGSRGLAIIGISLDDDKSKMQSVAKEKGMVWPMVCDPKGMSNQLSGEFGVTGIPHIVMISPDGEVVWDGHPSQLTPEVIDDQFQKHPPQLGPEAQREAAAQRLKDAQDLLKDKKDYAGALALLADVPDTLIKDKKVAEFGKDLPKAFEPAGDDKAAIEDALKGNADGTKRLASIKAALAPKAAVALGTRAAATQPGDESAAAASKAAAKGDNGAVLARGRLAAADRKKEAGDDVAAYRLYLRVTERWPGTSAGKTAAGAVAAYQADKTFMDKFAKADAQQKARDLLSMADGYLQQDKKDLARATYQQVIDQYPDTDAAPKAKAALAGMK